ncbi:HNH endonuclease [Streptococcus sp. 27098_8_66]|uniref:HNH endonuclease n=1 Tax=Streptococcus sp. 27098_8_66 TaxID=3003649 RepID=UPI00352E663D
MAEIVNNLPKTVTEDDKEKLTTYLEKIDQKYKKKARGRLFELDIDSISKPDCLTVENSHYWYSQYVRDGKNGLFSSFPEVKNINDVAICPICEEVFSTKITLEHIIPKNETNGDFRFSILPINLIKCCYECNTNDHSKKSDCVEESEINPYFESFSIDKYIEIEFKHISNNYIPTVRFKNFSDTDNFDKRIKHFIKIYNIERLYNRKLKLAYQKLLTVLKTNPFIYRRSILLDYFQHELKSYQDNVEYEKINNDFWIDQNYFAYRLCKKIVDPKDTGILDNLVNEIKNKRRKSNELVFHNQNLFDQWNNVKDENELYIFIQDNEKDIRNYYKHRKKYRLPFYFPNLYKDDSGKKEVVETILEYYLKNDKEFDTFKQKCSNVFT